jgi:hypothetical protein
MFEAYARFASADELTLSHGNAGPQFISSGPQCGPDEMSPQMGSGLESANRLI